MLAILFYSVKLPSGLSRWQEAIISLLPEGRFVIRRGVTHIDSTGPGRLIELKYDGDIILLC